MAGSPARRARSKAARPSKKKATTGPSTRYTKSDHGKAKKAEYEKSDRGKKMGAATRARSKAARAAKQVQSNASYTYMVGWNYCFYEYHLLWLDW
jgi:hypothetical protein